MVDNDKVIYSVDGERWVFRTVVSYGFSHAATYGPGTYVAVGNEGVIITTNTAPCCAWVLRSSDTTENLNGVGYGANTNQRFVAVGQHGTIVTSVDGVTWTRRNSNTTAALNGVAYGRNTFVVAGAHGTILTSDTGIDWIERSAGINTTLTNVAFGNGTFVAIGVQGKIFQSGVIPPGGNSGGSGLSKPPGSLSIE
jgi:photosystem II stability/assembly factor-like uncharacterized protein